VIESIHNTSLVEIDMIKIRCKQKEANWEWRPREPNWSLSDCSSWLKFYGYQNWKSCAIISAS